MSQNTPFAVLIQERNDDGKLRPNNLVPSVKADKADLARIAREWQLEEAEIARRALRAGLDVSRKFRMPGIREHGGRNDV